MSDPLVSIIVPVYNVENYLERCMKSIVEQSYNNIQVVVINDGSTDSSLSILNKIAKNDKRVKVFNKENGGQASARNLGLKEAEGEYILLVDSDDYLAKDTVKECIVKAQATDSDLVIFDFYNINDKGEKQYFKTGTRLDNARTVPWNKLFHKSLWVKYTFPEGYWYEDLGIIPAVVASAKNVVKIDEPLYYYETSRGSSQTNLINYEKLYDVIHMLKNVYQEIKNTDGVRDKSEEIEYLFIEHLLFVTLLLKLPHIKESKVKQDLVDNINDTIKIYVPNWEISKFKSGNFFNNAIKRFVIKSYLKKNFLIGDLIWKYPKKIKTILSGF